MTLGNSYFLPILFLATTLLVHIPHFLGWVDTSTASLTGFVGYVFTITMFVWVGLFLTSWAVALFVSVRAYMGRSGFKYPLAYLLAISASYLVWFYFLEQGYVLLSA